MRNIRNRLRIALWETGWWLPGPAWLKRRLMRQLETTKKKSNE